MLYMLMELAMWSGAVPIARTIYRQLLRGPWAVMWPVGFKIFAERFNTLLCEVEHTLLVSSASTGASSPA